MNYKDKRVLGVEEMLNITKIKFLFASFLFAISTSGGAMAENLIQTKQWSYFADTVMGGVSQGTAKFESSGPNKTIRLTGEVSTANNGGFIQVRSSIPQELAKGKTGIKIKVKGNGDQYFLHIRNSSTRLPWHYYQLGFDTSKAWTEVILPFDAFIKSSSFLRTSMNHDTIKTIGIVAYGKDYSADVSVMSMEFY